MDMRYQMEYNLSTHKIRDSTLHFNLIIKYERELKCHDYTRVRDFPLVIDMNSSSIYCNKGG